MKPAETPCKDCGATVAQDTHAAGVRLCCEPCRVEAARESQRRYRQRNPQSKPPRHASCQHCGTDLPPRTGPRPVAKRCADCKREAQREAGRRFESRRRAGSMTTKMPDALGSTVTRW